MKKTIRNITTVAAIIAAAAFTACNSGQNATDKADSANKALAEKADSTNKAATAAADSVNKLREDAAAFLVKSYESGLFEIQFSQLAATQAVNADVKSFANHLITQHKAFNDAMLKIAFAAHYKLPGAINNDHAKTLSDMGKIKGADFDKKYIDAMVSGHEKSVSNYTDAADKLEGGATKDYAAATLPKIKMHLDMAKKVQKGLK